MQNYLLIILRSRWCENVKQSGVAKEAPSGKVIRIRMIFKAVGECLVIFKRGLITYMVFWPYALVFNSILNLN